MVNARSLHSRIRAAETLRARVVAEAESRLAADDAACRAITDFEREFPITVDIERPIEDAFGDMTRLGIHALLVTRQGSCGIEPRIMGLITAREIEAAGRTRHERDAAVHRGCHSLRVADVMTAWDELSMVKYESLRCLTAGDLYERFQGTGLTHLLVVDADAHDTPVARGVLSRATLSRRLSCFGRPA